MPPEPTSDRLSLQQIHYLVPQGTRDGKYRCPRCHKWNLTINKQTLEFNCFSPECQGKATEIAAIMWAEVKRREAEPQRSDAPLCGNLPPVVYAMEKRLDWPLLQGWFLPKGATGQPEQHPYYRDVQGTCFPYWDEHGVEITQQWRWGMGKDQRRLLRDMWDGKPHKAYLYAGHFLEYLERKAENGEGASEIFLCEGESNTQTLWQNSLPAIGLPGVRTWKPEWANLKCFQAADVIYFLLDMMQDGQPEATAILGARKCAECFPPGKVRAVKLPVKDVSDLWKEHIDEFFGGGPAGFRADLKRAVLQAKPIVPEKEDIEGLPADLGAPVLDACLILKDFVELALPRLETDINNIVVDFLACAGAAIGLNAYAMHEADRHPAATFPLNIADTASGKGSCWGLVNYLFYMAVPDWNRRLRTSARSQQALYRQIHDTACEKIERKNRETGEVETRPNPRYTEGQLLLRYSEISGVFKSFGAEWSTLSQGFRDAHDGVLPLSNERALEEDSIVINTPYTLAVSGDVTPWELSEVIRAVDFANGCANRFIWSVSRKTKTIPRSKGRIDLGTLVERLKRVIPKTEIGEISYSAAGGEEWDAWVYSLPQETGQLGSACGRMRAEALRLCVLFAVLDEARLVLNQRPEIEARHVKAAAQIMERHRATVAWFLARPTCMPAALPETGKSKLWRQVEKVLGAIKDGQITGNELYRLFSNQTEAERRAIAEAAGLTAYDERDEKGNKITVWRGST